MKKTDLRYVEKPNPKRPQLWMGYYEDWQDHAYRNGTPKLIQALREAVGALSEIGKPITLDNCILNRPMGNMSTATETLTRIEALLTEGRNEQATRGAVSTKNGHQTKNGRDKSCSVG